MTMIDPVTMTELVRALQALSMSDVEHHDAQRRFDQILEDYHVTKEQFRAAIAKTSCADLVRE